MRLIVFTIFSCPKCQEYVENVSNFCKDHGLKFKCFDLDDPNKISFNLSSMRKWNLNKTPSYVILDTFGNMITKFEGIDNTLNHLKDHFNVR